MSAPQVVVSMHSNGSPPWTPRSAGVVLSFLLGGDPSSCLPKAGRKWPHGFQILPFACLPLPVCFQGGARPSRPKRRLFHVVPDHFGEIPSRLSISSILRSTRIEVSPNNPRAVRNDMPCRRRRQWTMARMSQESGQTPLGDLCGSIARAQGPRGRLVHHVCHRTGVNVKPSLKPRRESRSAGDEEPHGNSSPASSRHRRQSRRLLAAHQTSTDPQAATPLNARAEGLSLPPHLHGYRPAVVTPTTAGDAITSPRSPRPRPPPPSPRFSSIQPHHRRTAAGSLV